MTHTPLATSFNWTSDYSSRNGVKPIYAQIHHGATSNLAVMLGLQQPGGREVSSHVVIKDKQIIPCVPEEFSPWTSGSQWMDRQSFTAEITNSSTGGSWPVSEDTFHSVARWLADLHKRYGLALDDGHVVTHQEIVRRFNVSYATACPGDLQRRKGELLNLARQYAGSAIPTPLSSASAPPAPAPHYPATALYGDDWVELIQRDLIAMGHDLGAWGADGLDGKRTQEIVRFEQGMATKHGFRVGGKKFLGFTLGGRKLAVDGIAGEEFRAFLDWWFAKIKKAPAFPLRDGYYFGWADGGEYSISGYYGNDNRLHLARFQQRLKDRGWNVGDIDGLFGGVTEWIVEEFQAEKGLVRDGLIGVKTWAAAWTSPTT